MAVSPRESVITRKHGSDADANRIVQPFVPPSLSPRAVLHHVSIFSRSATRPRWLTRLMQTRRTTRRSIAQAELGVENDVSNRVSATTSAASTTAANANAGPSKPQIQVQKPIARRTALSGKTVLGDKVRLVSNSRRFVVFFPPRSSPFASRTRPSTECAPLLDCDIGPDARVALVVDFHCRRAPHQTRRGNGRPSRT